MYLLIYFFHSEARVYGSEANIAVAVLSENAVATLTRHFDLELTEQTHGWIKQP